MSLAVLGLISAMTLPSIFNNLQAGQLKATLKETLQMLSVATQAELMENGFQNGWHTLLKNRTNWTVSCETPTDTRCNLTGGLAGRNGNSFGFLLPNGAVMKFNENIANVYSYLYLDANGNTGPNVDGKDQVAICANLTPNVIGTPGQYTQASSTWQSGLRSGEVKPCTNHNSGVGGAYDKLFQ